MMIAKKYTDAEICGVGMPLYVKDVTLIWGISFYDKTLILSLFFFRSLFNSLSLLPFTPSLSLLDIIELHNGIWRTTIKDDGTGVFHTICLPLVQCNARSPRSVQSTDFRYAFHRYVREL
jgi:hypothetical protein